jgi:ankyrin repeat protein
MKIAEALLSHGATVDICNPRRFNQTPLMLACLVGQLDMVNLLVSSGSNIKLLNHNTKGGRR